MAEDQDTQAFGPATIVEYGPQPPEATEFEFGGVMTAQLASGEELLLVPLWFNGGIDLTGERAETLPPPPVGTICEFSFVTRLADTLVYSWDGNPWPGAETTPVNIVTGIAVVS